MLLLLVVLQKLSQVYSLCDSAEGCYPPVFTISDNYSNYSQRSVYTSSVCGSNSSVQYRSLFASDATLHTCQPTSLQAINVVDNEANFLSPTYWQSDIMTDNEGTITTPQFIVFNLTDEFLLHGVTIKFMAVDVKDPANSADARPRAFSIDKMDSKGQNWSTLEYFARDCATSFPKFPIYDYFSPDPDPNQVHCVQYDFYEENSFLDAFNEVEYSPGFRYDSFDNAYKNNSTVIDRYTASAIRIFILVPSSTNQLMSYVAVSDVTIDAQCKCNGHADSCGGQNNAICSCQHNTDGKQCDICLPLYNNRRWTLGTTSDAGLCLECTCNGRETSCHFDQVKGHGVCNNCTDNSEGDACDSCVSGFYVNPVHSTMRNNTDITAPGKTDGSILANNTGVEFCLACSCSKDGTQASSLSTCNVTTGQCVCKDYVTGRDCSLCQDTFWGLSANKTLGCDACNCNAQGSFGSINMCNKTTGVCICKANVKGSMCDSCKPYSFKFDPGNPDGCTLCDCDPGASSSKVCDLATGQCSCYSNIGGRDCRLPLADYFVPPLDALVLEPEIYTALGITLRSGHGTKDATVSGQGFVKLTSAKQINITFNSPLTAEMSVVLRFEKTTSDNFIFLQGTLSLKSAGGYSCSDGQIISTGKQWNLSFTGTENNIRGGAVMGKVCLYNGAIYNIQVKSPTSALLVDSIVFVLDTSAIISALKDRIDVGNATKCALSVVNTVRSARSSCAQVEYSLAAAVLQKALPCSCVGGAIASTGCNSYTGDCNCLPGVLSPDCKQCMVDHYQFTIAAGCKACGCHKNGSIFESCDDLGACQCLGNVQGPKCDACIPGYYGLHTGKGCSPCQCNITYSTSSSCSDYGECPCLPGVAGPTCYACQDGYYNLTTNGCTRCSCDQDGSTDRSCDIVTGNCECLARTEGSTCSQCKPGYFGIGKWHPDGCISCFCWDHGQNCSSAIGWHDAPIISSWAASDISLLSEIWQAEDSNGIRLSVITPHVTTANGSLYALRIDETQRNESSIFYVAPNKFLGDRKSSYGRYLSVRVKPSPTTPLSVGSIESDGSDDVTLTVEMTGQFSDVTLIYDHIEAGNLTADSDVSFNVPLLESEWQAVVTTSSGNDSFFKVNNTATYTQMMEILSSLYSLKILAYRGNVSHSALDLLSVRLDNAVDGSKSSGLSGIIVNNVEMCSCKTGYTGNSCEKCAQHYTRAITNSTDPGSLCVPCSCNGHGVMSCDRLSSNCSDDRVTSCDPTTGVCLCQHHTEGEHCETCLPGYYGDPRKGTKDDCQPCACPGVIVANETNVFATSCSQNLTTGPVCIDCQEGHAGNHCELCIDGYYGTPENASNSGGACKPCECNGRTDTCNSRTGECTGCTNNTAGQNCDICAPGYFGDVMNLTCQPCACTFVGSTGLCNHVTGLCECLTNVTGAQCDQCIDGSFNLTASVGCEPCNCFMNGSLSSVCDKMSGQCPCRNLTSGRMCNECQPSYWNVNPITGCDDCQCNLNGTISENGTTDASCDVITGQCTCALPGIMGRTCDHCSPISTKTFEHVDLFYMGTYPSCQLCGECFDSWADRVEETGQNLTQMNKTVHEIWSAYDFQTAEEVGTALTAIEEKLNKTAESQKNFEGISNQLKEMRRLYSEAQAQCGMISSEVDMLKVTEQTLTSALISLTSLTDMVQVTNSTMVSLTDLRQQFQKLTTEAEAAISQGNSSWPHIQSLTFVVLAPEDRERQIQAQLASMMDISARANQTLLLTQTLYDTSLSVGVSRKSKELASLSERISNVSQALMEMNAVITSVQNDVASSNASLRVLLVESDAARIKMLNCISNLQVYVRNASQAQKVAEKLFTDVNTFKAVAEKAEQTIINSTTTLLGDIHALFDAQNNLTQALVQSTSSLSIEIPTQESMQELADQIEATALSVTEVENLKTSSLKAKFEADQAVMKAQRALSVAKKLNEEVRQMEDDIILSGDLRAQAEGLRLSCDSLNNTIQDVLQQARNHSDKVSADITAVTQSALDMQTEIKNVSLCLIQRQVDVANAVTSANQAKERADSTSSAQLQLLQTMMKIRTSISLEVPQIVSNLTSADSAMKQMHDDLVQIEELAQIEVLIQDLETQNQQINELDLEVTKLASELDSIILLLQESVGGAGCNTV